MSTVAYFSYNFYRYRYNNEWKNETVLDIFCNQSDKKFLKKMFLQQEDIVYHRDFNSFKFLYM